MPVYFGIEEINFTTPQWLWDHCTSHGGGWAFPILVGAEHPVVVEPEKWPCFHCDEVFEAGDVVIPMPWGGGEPKGPARWIAEHRECMITGIIEDPAERAKCRPPGYATFAPDRQWRVDKRLKILDWDPDAKPVFGSALADALKRKKS